jgi:hypothetical protein
VGDSGSGTGNQLAVRDRMLESAADFVLSTGDRPASGNALALVITGTGKRVAVAYDGIPAGAPLLRVEYAASAVP